MNASEKKEGQNVNPNLEALFQALPHLQELTSDMLAEISRLHDDIEAEFGDPAQNVEVIKNDFLRLYNAVPQDSPLKSSRQYDSRQIYNTPYFAARDRDYLENLYYNQPESLQNWVDYLLNNSFWPYLSNLNGELISGGLKSQSSLAERLASKNKKGEPESIIHARDLMRGRFIGESLKDVQDAVQIFRETSMPHVVAFFNYYAHLFRDWRADYRPKPYVAANFTFAIDPNLTFELQCMTRRAHIIGELDHPVMVKKKVTLTPENHNRLVALGWGSHLHDFREFLGPSSATS